LYGAALGSIVPGIGTAAGAIVGGAIGLISGGLEAANRNAEDAKKANEAKEDRIEKALNKLAEKEAKIFMDSNQVGMGLTLGKNYAV
jgi:adenosyl cobinamide kinase/adenosyl cobinamide phosphate guanylyltransferase